VAKKNTGKTNQQAMAANFATPSSARTLSFAQQDTVTLLVGSDVELLVAHKSFITRDSKFFKAAMKKEWVEGQTHIIKLPKEDVAMMTSYLTFTYTSELPTSTMTAAPSGGPKDSQWESLVELYRLGDRILDKRIRNAVIKEILRIEKLFDKRRCTFFMPVSVIDMCFDATSDQSPIR
jgi:hypothetical protein